MELFIFLLGDPSLFNVVLVIGRRVFAQWCAVQPILDNLTRQRKNDGLHSYLVKLPWARRDYMIQLALPNADACETTIMDVCWLGR